jgi:hypothetical protein
MWVGFVKLALFDGLPFDLRRLSNYSLITLLTR